MRWTNRGETIEVNHRKKRVKLIQIPACNKMLLKYWIKTTEWSNFICSVTASIIWYTQKKGYNKIRFKKHEGWNMTCFHEYLVPMGYSWCALTGLRQWGQPGTSFQPILQISVYLLPQQFLHCFFWMNKTGRVSSGNWGEVLPFQM